MLHLRTAWLFATALLLAPAPCAQVAPAPPPPREAAQEQAQEREVSAVALRELVAVIKDPDRRAVLLEQLEAMLAALEPEEEVQQPTVVEAVSGFFRRLARRLGQTSEELLQQLAALPGAVRGFWRRLQDPAERAPLLADGLRVAAAVVAAWLAALLVGLALRRWRTRLGEVRNPLALTPLLRATRALLRLALGLLPALAATTVVFVAVGIAAPSHAGGAVAIAIVAAFAVHRAGRAVLQAVLAPAAPDLRLVPMREESAAALTRSLSRILALVAYGYFGLAAAAAMGAEPAVLQPLRELYALALVVCAAGLVLKYRKRFALPPPSDEEDPLAPPRPTHAGRPLDRADAAARTNRARWLGLARAALSLWWVAALVYIVGLYLLWISGIEDGFGTAVRATLFTVLWIAAAIVALSLAHGLLARLQRRLQQWTLGLPVVRRSVPRYVGLLRIIVDAAIVVFAAGLVLEAWGVGAIDALGSELVRSVLSAVLGVAFIVMIALAASDVSTALAQTYLERKQREARDSAKIRTLVPLANKAIRAAIAILAITMVLSQIGVAIGPILASVGFLGLALGFGAQTLVKDLISGVFNLVEDNVSTGHVVQVGDTGGIVESINIRTIQLRDLSGNVHTIPWGEIGKLTNFTKEYGRYLIECGVAYREDCDEVMEVLRELGAELQRDPVYGPKMLEPIEILGVDRFEDSAVVIRARLKTLPIEQWSVGREFNRRMKKRFDELGIEIPFPHRTIYLGEGKDGGSPPLHVVRNDREEA